MNELLALPFEAQAVLFSGYLAYKIATIGRAVQHRTEDFLLQVIAFGSLARLIPALAFQLITLAPNSQYSFPARYGDNAHYIAVFTLTALSAVTIAIAWRTHIEKWWVKKMSDEGVYQDDHQSTTWRSLLEEKAEWRYVQVHTDDGLIFESSFADVATALPGTDRLILNDDGIAMYVTKVFRADEKDESFPPFDAVYGATITYFPFAKTRRVDIGWMPDTTAAALGEKPAVGMPAALQS